MLETLTIHDSGSGARAEFLPGRGFTCCSATLPAGDRLVELVWCPEGFREPGARASSGGIPILCPYPGRLASTSMPFEGRTFELEPVDPLGRPIAAGIRPRAVSLKRPSSCEPAMLQRAVSLKSAGHRGSRSAASRES